MIRKRIEKRRTKEFHFIPSWVRSPEFQTPVIIIMTASVIVLSIAQIFTWSFTSKAGRDITQLKSSCLNADFHHPRTKDNCKELLDRILTSATPAQIKRLNVLIKKEEEKYVSKWKIKQK